MDDAVRFVLYAHELCSLSLELVRDISKPGAWKCILFAIYGNMFLYNGSRAISAGVCSIADSLYSTGLV